MEIDSTPILINLFLHHYWFHFENSVRLQIRYREKLCNIQGQAGLGSEQPDLVEDDPACCRGSGLHDL